MKKRVLITGATGFVGSNLARRLIADGHDVHLAVREGHRSWRISGLKGVQIHRLALTDPEGIEAVVAKVKPQWIFHLAVYGAYSDQRDWPRMVETNVIGTGNLLNACMKTGFEAFINTGSSSEYGFKISGPREDERLEPNSSYAVTKAAATMQCTFMARAHDLPLATLRLYSVYGPMEEPTRLIPQLLINGLSGKFPTLVNPEIARDFVYVSDVCDAYLAAAQKAGQLRGDVFNVASGNQTTLREIIDVTSALLEIKEAPEWGSMPARAWDTNVWVGDPSKIKMALGWTASTGLREGLSRFTDWLRDNPGMLKYYSNPNQ